MTMKASDTSLDLALWTDANTIEAFWQGGRSCRGRAGIVSAWLDARRGRPRVSTRLGPRYWTVPLSCDAVGNNTKQGISLFANASATASSATVYAVDSIWDN